MKIGYVCNEYPPAPHGGIGVFVHIIAHAMKKRGHSVTVIGLGQEDQDRDDNGVRVVTLARTAIRGVSSLVDRWRLRQWLIHAVREGRVDLVEVPDYEGMLPFPFHACPVVVRLHLTGTAIALHGGQRPSRGRSLCESYTLGWRRHWIAVSQYVLGLTTETFGLKPNTAIVIPNPALLPPENPEDDRLELPDNFILYAGTVCERKGAYTLAQAARRFLQIYSDVHLVYAGAIISDRGIPADQCIREIVGPVLSPRVHFLGRVRHAVVGACMHRARLFAFPSTLEAFPLVAVEAMLSGLPIVVSDSGPFPEFVRNGETGLLVSPQDSAALSAAVESLLESPALSCSLGRNAAHDMKARFSVEHCACATEECYSRLISSKSQQQIRRLAIK
jgi:glycosyltransferase involved in cell wall biosynthesis